MFEPDIFGWPASSFLSLSQTLLTPALGFAFLYLMRLPLTKFSWVPGDASYVPSRWVVPLFAQGAVFAMVSAFSVYLFANYFRAPDLSAEIGSEFFLRRELAIADPASDVTVALMKYDGFSHFRVFVNGYHVFSTTRDCVASFQCKPEGEEKASKEAIAFNALTTGRGSVYYLSRANPLGEEISLRHYLVAGQNHIDLLSENSATGGCELTAAVAVRSAQQTRPHALRVFSHRGAEPLPFGLLQDEHFYAGGTPPDVGSVERYKTSKHERRGAVCERVRIVLTLTEAQAAALSTDLDFAGHFKALQAEYICATIGSAVERCGVWPI
ncbi:MAG: hypothetical protein ACXWVB_04025 [Rhodoplanes sp.]